jgi:hypothetical protein
MAGFFILSDSYLINLPTMKPKRRKERKIRKEVIDAWNERIEIRSSGSSDLGFSASVIEYQMELAHKLQEMRLEYVEEHHKEPELTEFEMILIAKYC